MCVNFEPSLLEFRQAAKGNNDQDLEIVYVPSDRSEEASLKRAQVLDMLSVPFGESADKKAEFKIWAGSESTKLGSGRRSGVPALVVLDGESGKELAFLPAEAQGAASLKAWPLDDDKGIW